MTTETVETLKKLNFCVFDLETTGGNQKSDKIIEIGLVNIDNMEIGEKKNYLINPERKIPDFIQKLTSIKQEDVADSPRIEDVIDEILEIIGDRILVAHNASFDVPFFNSVLKRLNRPVLENKSICTNLMTKYLIPTLMNSNLNYMSKIFGISHKKAHRALDDANATAKLFLNYLNIFIDKNIAKINHLYYPKNRYELDLVNFKKEMSLEDIKKKLNTLHSPFLATFKGENGIITYAFPSSGSEDENEFIIKKLQEVDWELLTVKLIGPFTEVIIKFNHLFSKLNPEDRKEVMNELWNRHLPSVSKADLQKKISDNDNNDFIIINHLVPDQYTIYPMIALGHRNELIFRYPGHKKKLIQYINSKSNKISNNKMRKVNYAGSLKEFLDCYIATCTNKDSEVFLFDKSSPTKRQEEFFTNLEEFLAKNPNTYDYPKKYI